MSKNLPSEQTSSWAPLEQRLDIVIRLLSALLTKGQTKKDAILALANLQLAPKQISAILGISQNQVNVTLYSARRSTKKRTLPKDESPDARE
jgi:DNA-directed RNA polymerase specialized sigma24 family protein